MTRRAVVTLAAVALAAGVIVSEARAVGKCNSNVFSEEIASACGSSTGAAFRACSKQVIANCKTTDCSCTDPALPACGTTTTTSTTTTTTSTSSATTSSTVTATTTTTATTIFGTT